MDVAHVSKAGWPSSSMRAAVSWSQNTRPPLSLMRILADTGFHGPVALGRALAITNRSSLCSSSGSDSPQLKKSLGDIHSF